MTYADTFSARARRIDQSFRTGRITMHEYEVRLFELEQEAEAHDTAEHRTPEPKTGYHSETTAR